MSLTFLSAVHSLGEDYIMRFQDWVSEKEVKTLLTKLEKDLKRVVPSSRIEKDNRYGSRYYVVTKNTREAKKAQVFLNKNVNNYNIKNVEFYTGMSARPIVIFEFEDLNEAITFKCNFCGKTIRRRDKNGKHH